MRNSGRINLELLAMCLNLFVTELLFNALTLPPMIHRTIDKTEDARNFITPLQQLCRPKTAAAGGRPQGRA
jgi:hypothetical protein